MINNEYDFLSHQSHVVKLERYFWFGFDVLLMVSYGEKILLDEM